MTDISGFSENAVKLACMLNLGWDVVYDFETKTETVNGVEIPLAPSLELQMSGLATLDKQTGRISLTEEAKEAINDSIPAEEWERMRKINRPS